MPRALTDDEVQVLDLEARHWPNAGTKEQAIREQLEISPTRYYMILSSLLERPEAHEHAPQTVARVGRQLATKKRPTLPPVGLMPRTLQR